MAFSYYRSSCDHGRECFPSLQTERRRSHLKEAEAPMGFVAASIPCHCASTRLLDYCNNDLRAPTDGADM